MDARFDGWLEGRLASSRVRADAKARLKRIERAYGDLDGHWRTGRLQSVRTELEYGMADKRAGRGNPPKIEFQVGADLRNGLGALRNALDIYLEFKAECSSGRDAGQAAKNDTVPERVQGFALELVRRLEQMLGHDQGSETDASASSRHELAREPGRRHMPKESLGCPILKMLAETEQGILPRWEILWMLKNDYGWKSEIVEPLDDNPRMMGNLGWALQDLCGRKHVERMSQGRYKLTDAGRKEAGKCNDREISKSEIGLMETAIPVQAQELVFELMRVLGDAKQPLLDDSVDSGCTSSAEMETRSAKYFVKYAMCRSLEGIPSKHRGAGIKKRYLYWPILKALQDAGGGWLREARIIGALPWDVQEFREADEGKFNAQFGFAGSRLEDEGLIERSEGKGWRLTDRGREV